MINLVSNQSGLPVSQVSRIINLFEGGATIPFLARYRKEATGNLDEVQLTGIRELWLKTVEFVKRKSFVIETIEASGNLTSELRQKIEDCTDAAELEDIYLPFKPKRNTKAEKARQMGLEPLAAIIMAQKSTDIHLIAKKFVGDGKAANADEAIEGAGFIVAEWINENAYVRQRLRNYFNRKSIIGSKKVKDASDDQETYRLYYDYTEPVYKAPSHRLLAIFRGENEGVLKVKIQPDSDESLELIERVIIKPASACGDLLKGFVKDSYQRLLSPSLENEIRAALKLKADEKAIDVFGKNLEQLLMLPPMPGKRVLAIDPGFRTGCKVVCLDQNGNLLHNETIYPHPPQRETALAMKKINTLVQQFNIEAIAIGNGTAGRETEQFIKGIRFSREVVAVMVNESGASVYSASEVARREFPQYDITVRGAVSIGRRLSDPLAELVKIDPKAIGVGQYQHDVDQKLLKNRLDDVVVSCVNRVGVDVNSASPELLQYVSGLGQSLANNIVEYRRLNGNFTSRKELLKVSKLGPKAFEQSAGFIRIRDAKNPLDNTAVHPESYDIALKMAKDSGFKIEDFIRNKEALTKINPQDYVNENAGIETVKDIIDELQRPNRDPRQKVKTLEFNKEVRKVDDLKEGMELSGVVTNITGFGAFVDIGVHQDGLIHVSNLADRFVSDPHEIVKINDFVKVEVLKVEPEKKRINLKLISKI